MNEASFRMAFRGWFGLRQAETEVLLVLYVADGSPRTPNDIAAQAGVRHGSVQFHISRLRQALEAEAIDFEDGAGYRLTDIGRGECLGALWTVGDELRRAS